MDATDVDIRARLLAEMAWVRRLARGLVKDEAVADDLAQETWLAASSAPPPGPRPLRPWLTRVVLNLVRMRHRGEARRSARELASALGSSVPTPAELVERVQTQRAVAAEVLALAEPYRTTVLLHYLEDLGSVEIARQLGIPEGTVRRRLKVARDQLRSGLASRLEGRRDWRATLGVLAAMPSPQARPALGPAIGVVLMKKWFALAVALLVLLAIGVSAWRPGRSARESAAQLTVSTRGRQPFTTERSNGEPAPSAPDWIGQPGVPARGIAGRVVSSAGPVSGAKVRLGFEVPGSAAQPIAELLSSADGGFDFGPRPATRFVVSAAAAGLTAAALTVELADPRVPAEALTLRLDDCRARLHGHVREASGAAVPGARITTAGLSGAEADGAGRYDLCIPPGEFPAWTVRAEAPGYGAIELPIHTVGELQRDLILVPQAVLTGRVVGELDRPIAGAYVLARPDPSEAPHFLASSFTVTDAQGRFTLAGLAAGRFRVTARAEGLGTATPVLVVARPGASSQELHIVVAALSQIRGRVLLDGRPAPGARVEARLPGQVLATPGYAQPDGTFVLTDVRRGTVELAAPPFEVRTPRSLRVDVPVIDEVVIEVGKRARVQGRVTRHGRPMANADVGCSVAAPVKTDAQGTFAFEGLPAGEVRFYAIAWGEKACSEETVVRLSPGEERGDIEIDLSRGARAQGTVVDPQGAPVAGVYVRLTMADGSDEFGESMTDPQGRFDCPAMTGGGDYLPAVYPSPAAGRAFPPARGDRHALVAVGRDEIRTGIVLAIKPARGSIGGKIVDDTGAPVPDVHVEAIGRGLPGAVLPATTTDGVGDFQIRDLAPGTYNLHAHAADGSEAMLDDVATGTANAGIVLARPGSIEGRLVGFSSPPMVVTHTSNTDLHITGHPVVEGEHFSQSGLPPGRYTVQAQVGDESDGQLVEIRSGAVTRLVLRRRGLGQVAGRVTDFVSGAPLPGLRCDVLLSMNGQAGNLPPDESRRVMTDADGRFSAPAPLGRVRVFCFPPTDTGQSPAGDDVEVKPGVTATVAARSVRGRFKGSAGDLGFGLVPFTLPITVGQVAPRGPAALAGLAMGDHLVAIDGATLEGVLPAGAALLLANTPPGTNVTLKLERAGSVRIIKVAAVAGTD